MAKAILQGTKRPCVEVTMFECPDAEIHRSQFTRNARSCAPLALKRKLIKSRLDAFEDPIIATCHTT